MTAKPIPNRVRIGAWQVDARAGRIRRAGGEERALEPKVMDLLTLLAARPGEVVTHEEILAALWPDVVVGDDTLARCVSKLRKAFDDDPRTPAYVETIAKRGYRLIASVEADGPPPPVAAPRAWFAIAGGVVALIALGLLVGRFVAPHPAADANATLIARAKDAYFQYTRADNETAIALYERVLASEPDNAPAQAGLATALVQRVLRWPNPPGAEDFSRTTLGQALADGRTDTPEARRHLERARALAVRAARLAPDNAFVQQALGLSAAAQRDFDVAEAAYARAVQLDADAWGALINLGDTQDILGHPARALPYYERAYAAMERVYDREPQRVRIWLAELGVLIARRHLDAGRADEAEGWYRRVLAQAPLHADAVAGLATLLESQGDARAARALCATLVERTGPHAACAGILP